MGKQASLRDEQGQEVQQTIGSAAKASLWQQIQESTSEICRLRVDASDEREKRDLRKMPLSSHF